MAGGARGSGKGKNRLISNKVSIRERGREQALLRYAVNVAVDHAKWRPPQERNGVASLKVSWAMWTRGPASSHRNGSREREVVVSLKTRAEYQGRS